MSTTNGIDYGALSPTTNHNPETGIRYGIARLGDLADWILSAAEPEYWRGCPACGDDDLPEDFESPAPCPTCGEDIADGEEWSDESSGSTLEEDGVSLRIDDMGDVWVFASPVVTTGRHCSPCAPGAVSIGPDPVRGGVEAYGLPAEYWARGEE